MVCYSPEILDELEVALKYPKIRKLASSSETESLIDAIKILGILIIPAKTVEICRDKKDKEFEGTKIVSPHDFGQAFLEQDSNYP